MEIRQGGIIKIGGLDETAPGHFYSATLENPCVEKKVELSPNAMAGITMKDLHLRELAESKKDVKGTKITLFEGEGVTVSITFTENGLEIKRYSLLRGLLFKKVIPSKEIYKKEPKRKKRSE